MPVVIKTKSLPSPDLLTCARAPDGFPVDPNIVAKAPPAVRKALDRIAPDFGANARQLNRLINHLVPGSCPAGAE